jgi:hypothetical protein
VKDPIVEEVRKARQDHAQQFNHDSTEICCDLKKIEKKCGNRLISLPPKLLKKRGERENNGLIAV